MLPMNQQALFFRHRKWVFAIAAAVVLLGYFFIDIPVAELFHSLPLIWRKPLRLLTDLIDPKYNNYVWPVLFFLFSCVLEKKVWGNRFLLVAVSIPVGNLFVWILKFLSARPRPDIFFSEHLYGFFMFYLKRHVESFPSGHAAAIGAICGAFSCFYPRLSPLFAIAGLLLAMTRVALGLHFFSDVIAGFTIGLVAAQWVYTALRKQRIQFN